MLISVHLAVLKHIDWPQIFYVVFMLMAAEREDQGVAMLCCC